MFIATGQRHWRLSSEVVHCRAEHISKFEAGSVLTTSTRLPISASAIAIVAAIVVLPTPPLPVNSRKRVRQRVHSDADSSLIALDGSECPSLFVSSRKSWRYERQRRERAAVPAFTAASTVGGLVVGDGAHPVKVHGAASSQHVPELSASTLLDA